MAERTSRRIATLAVAVGLLFLGDWSAPTEGTALSRTITIAALPLVIPVARWSIGHGWAAVVAILGGIVAGPVRSVVYDPLRDPDCTGCFEGALGAYADLGSARVLAILGAALVVTGLVAGVRRRSPATWVLAAVGVLGVLDLTPLTDARAAVAAAAAAIVARLLRHWWSRRRLERLVAGVAAAPDVAGLAAAERDAAGRDWVVPEVRVGLEQARLRADLDRRVAELADSRRRIVERADTEARRLERDLHDGAQPLLLDLGLAISAAHAARPTHSLKVALAETRACIDDLRTVARAAFPPVLESAGLGPAVVALTGGRLLTLDLPSARLDPVVERTAFLVVAEVYRGADEPIGVTGRLLDGHLDLAVTGAPPPPESVSHDRVAALGGTMTSDGNRTEVTLPCA